jgi:predicted nucleotidyltransferase
MLLNKNFVEYFDSPAKMAVAARIIKPGFVMSGRELAKLCGLSHSWVINILKEYEGINFISGRRTGKTVIWTAKTNSYAYITACKLFGSSRMFSPLTHLKELIIKNLKGLPVKKAVIFGSVAQGAEKPDSDIDLFVLIGRAEEKKKTEDSLKELSFLCGEIFGNTLHFYILAENEYKKKEKSGLIKNIEKGIRVI